MAAPALAIALLAAARGAADALRRGAVRVSWLRDVPDAPATGCAP